ncbi:MAG: aspartyl protease family protein [Desulfuromonadales bacterium]|nr:aspartyl protease family protein [Desulfuromonadales bacterium]
MNRRPTTTRYLCLRTAFFLLLCGAGCPTAALAEFYKYIDRNGVTVFVDEEHKIPPQYRQHRQTYREELDHLPAEQRAAIREERQREDAAAREQRQARESRQREEQRRRDYEEAMTTPVTIRGNQVLVPVQVASGGRRVKVVLLLDTGASRTVFHRGAIQSLQLPAGQKSLIQVAGGALINTEVVRFSQLRVGPFEIPGPSALVIEHSGLASGMDGLLGMDFLRNLNFRIDYDKQLIHWQP